jgi:hypothetical protein
LEQYFNEQKEEKNQCNNNNKDAKNTSVMSDSDLDSDVEGRDHESDDECVQREGKTFTSLIFEKPMNDWDIVWLPHQSFPGWLLLLLH